MAAFGRSFLDIRANLPRIGAAMAHYPIAKPYTAMGRDGVGFVLDD
jgi:hypothetical protein